jgi:hypothetical protein
MGVNIEDSNLKQKSIFFFFNIFNKKIADLLTIKKLIKHTKKKTIN